MAGLSPRELDAFRRILDERRKVLIAEIRTKLAEAKGELIGADEVTSIDGGDRAFLDLASELDLAMAERDIQELQDLDAAVERLESGHFGTCTDCSESVAPARLKAYPTAGRCNACQTRHEAHSPSHHKL
jgi:RNA polymerase-binding protein DksA